MKESKFLQNQLFVVNEPIGTKLSPSVALEIGLNESIMFLQIGFWIAISRHEKDGKMWTYQSIRDIQKQFPFWSTSTINRIIQSLEDANLIIVDNFNSHKYDRTRWFALNPDGVRKLKSVTLVGRRQDGTGSAQDGTGSAQDGTTIPETTTETTTEITNTIAAKKPAARGRKLPPISAMYKEKTSVWPNKVQVELIEGTVKDVPLFARVIDYWMSHGWNPRNVADMLEMYKSGGPPANGARARPAPTRPLNDDEFVKDCMAKATFLKE